MNSENIVFDTLPDVLIEYLYDIVVQNSEVESIRLIPMKLGSSTIQEIIIEAHGDTERRRAFGFTPVHARFKVLRNESEIPALIAA